MSGIGQDGAAGTRDWPNGEDGEDGYVQAYAIVTI